MNDFEIKQYAREVFDNIQVGISLARVFIKTPKFESEMSGHDWLKLSREIMRLFRDEYGASNQ